jgi:4-hydroxybenzoate polyprenyltransferase
MREATAGSGWNLRALLVLGRVSNLPTVCSNCLAAWVLGGGGRLLDFVLLNVGAALLYLAGLYLNDAFDADFDRQRRPARPIPSGQVTHDLVWRLGWLWLSGGVGVFLLVGWESFVVAVVLAGLIVLYNAVHKRTALSVLLMGSCRFLLYLLGAASARELSGLAIWSGLALGAYVVGLSYLARKESILGPVSWWPAATLVVPAGLAFLANGPGYRERAFSLSLLLAIWILPSLRFAFRKGSPQIGFAVSNLLAGIVLVDLLATASEPWFAAPAFGALFVLALLLQRFVPAT